MKGNDTRKILRELEAAGYQISKTGGGHWMIKDQHGGFVTTTANTSRSVSGTRNLKAAIRRHERQQPERSTA